LRHRSLPPALPPALLRSCLLASPAAVWHSSHSPHVLLAVSTVPRAIPSWGLSWPVSAPGLQPRLGCCHAPASVPGTGRESSCHCAHLGANPVPRAARCSPHWGTGQAPTITLPCSQGSHGCPPTPSCSQSCAQGKEGYTQPPAMASGVFSTGSGPCLPTGNRCAVPCGLPCSPTSRTDPAVILFQRSPAGTSVPLNPSRFPGSTVTWYRHWFWSISVMLGPVPWGHSSGNPGTRRLS